MRSVWLRLILPLLVLGVVSCGDKVDPLSAPPPDNGGGGPVGVVSYEADIRPVFEAHCTLCHAVDKQGDARNGAPVQVNLDSYSAAVSVAQAANLRIQSGTMPPTGGIPQTERALFQQWLEEGMPEKEAQ
ncbi:hypothetical protein LLH00_03570 [bacterium]|nr:hypothetical protein [bacterium]